jgi:hypothetical protein
MSFIMLVAMILLAPLYGGLMGDGQNDGLVNAGHVTSDDLHGLSDGIIGTAYELETHTFPAGSFVIPMDDKQNDILKAFGFTHALLRNSTPIYRIIEPPDIIIETALHPAMELFAGGPILVMPGDAATVGAVRLRFPTVSLDNTITEFTSDMVDRIIKPTRILVIYGLYGHTQDVLTDMGIPFTLTQTSEVEMNPGMLFDYDVIVDDCPGWYGFMPLVIVDIMRTIARDGGEIIFTDIALLDMELVFPGHVSVVTNVEGTWPCSMYRIPEFPGQYYGPSTLDIYTMGFGRVMGNILDPEVRVMVDSNDYAGEYRILAAYFFFGATPDAPGGIVEGFGYHPGDQPPDARALASILYGNKFVHPPSHPDLEVTPPDIVFNPPSPVAIDTSVTINATIHNIGGRNAADVAVRFYDGDPAFGIQISADQIIPLIDREGGIGYAEVNWIAAGMGPHDIHVVADPDDVIAESNETNNIAYNNIEVIGVMTPWLVVESAGDDSLLNGTQPQASGLSHYLIYRAQSQTGFDFSDVWMNTSVDVNPSTGMLDPLNPEWIDTNVTRIGDSNYRDECYYIVRAVNALGMRSGTSNTAGYYVLSFTAGTNTFSLPLQPFGDLPLYTIMNEIGAVSMSVLDDNDMWQTYQSDPSIDARLGTGYVVELDDDTRYVFTGEPASMVMYNEGFGFDDASRDDLGATVNWKGDVALTWSAIPNAEYYVYWSATRDGFFRSSFTILNGGNRVLGLTFVHTGGVTGAGENYYMIIPYDKINDTDGSSTYSIGVWTAEYNGNDMFGLPLKPVWGAQSADWYVDELDNCLGVVFLENGLWKAHFKEFPEGVYDTLLEVGKGYELTVYDTSRFSYIGW